MPRQAGCGSVFGLSVCIPQPTSDFQNAVCHFGDRRGAEVHAIHLVQMALNIPHGIPSVYIEMIFASNPSNRVWCFSMICGSKVPWRSRGTSMVTSPDSVSASSCSCRCACCRSCNRPLRASPNPGDGLALRPSSFPPAPSSTPSIARPGRIRDPRSSPSTRRFSFLIASGFSSSPYSRRTGFTQSFLHPLHYFRGSPARRKANG